VPDHITPITLPPYSPERNPVENLWHDLHEHHWANRAYEDYDAIRQAACDAWQAACLTEQTIQSICRVSSIEGVES